MPATIATPAPAQPTTTNTGLSADLAATGQQAGPGSFAALIEQLSGSSSAAAEAGLADVLPQATNESPGDILAALLPFLEAMGLTQTGIVREEALDDAETAADMPVGLPAIAGMPADGAVPLAVPAISAAGLTAVSAPWNAPAAPPPMTSGPLGGNAVATALAPQATAPADDLAAGEFMAQWVATTEHGTEAPHPATAQATAQPSMASPAAAMPVAPSGNGSVTALSVPQPVGAAGWDREVGNQVVWLAHQGGSRAELVLTPPQMGRIEVSLSLSGDQANASFISANPVVREALEAALPRLREVLAEAGIQLGQAQVGAENMRQSAQQEKNGDNPAAGRTPGPSVAMPAAGHPLAAAGLKIGRGLVDVFA